MKRFGLVAATAAALVFLSIPAVPQAQTDNSTEKSAKSNADTYRQLNLFAEVFERVRSDYVEEVSDEQLIEAAINGMLSSLDPHSSYLNAKNFKDMQVQTRGEFGGLGIEVTMENGLVKVVSPIDDTPAAKAGLKPNDLITHLDGEPILGLTLPEAVEKMRGPVNSEVKLTIRREGREPFDVTLTRAVVRIQSVKSHLEGDNVGYIRITSFNEQTDSGLHAAVKSLQEKAGNKLVGYVLDLRNNPGGLLDQAIAVSNDFLQRGEIVSTRGRRPDDAQRYNARPGDITNGLPVVVLINGGSASASEIVAGALQDHRRAILLGTRSFGKGSVQTIIPLPGHGAIRLTTARYYTPSGRSIQAKGIEPDIVVEPAKIERIANGDALRHEADLKGALKNPDAPTTASGAAPKPNVPPGTTPAATPGKGEQNSVDPLVLGTAEDYQLARAVDMLRGLSLFNGRTVN
ncbi:MAG TPA: S41 family peptidase [Stellaceae bacterium]|nr:S41 family peptidase [Stellaceae bacterium]